ncbi:sulfate permease [Coleophoma crateriformis]|uniref:Sulfate permease n=1 Tax=Coleophoma crateriformis TaxID=565419 RepID=A0A3D8T9H7_9HELO|nr:sulfate permease [Coleophoma crateriformis]
MSSTLGTRLARVLGIELDSNKDKVTRGESVLSIQTVDSYVEQDPTPGEYLRELAPSGKDIGKYFYDMFPFLQWIMRYNAQWFMGDMVAGITVGAVVVPQSMAYAKLASLDAQFGLYSAFMGVLIYWFFATSKDITIGPVAVMSTITGNIVLKAATTNPDIPGHVIASALAIVAGGIITGLGLLRLGFIVDLIPLPSIAAFMTGSAISIAAGQVPSLMGIPTKSSKTTPVFVNTREATYLVIINTLKHLGLSKLDAAMGLTALAILYIIRTVFNYAARKAPQHRKFIFFLNTLRTAFVILLYTMISWLVNRHHRKSPKFNILGSVPRGFQNIGVPVIDRNIVKAFASEIPVTVIVLLIEHISISKSFGRVNNYAINPSQELLAIGIANLFGPFFGAYPATGSFSRTAIKSKAGVRTPLAGVITALVVLLAIYALTAVFFYIPNSVLSAVIIHAVGDLITPPATCYQFYKVSPIDLIIFFAGVIITVFTSIENGIYVTVAVSAGVLGFRLMKAKGTLLGKVTVQSVREDTVFQRPENNPRTPLLAGGHSTGLDELSHRNLFLPIDHTDGSNPEIQVTVPEPGIFIYRFSEGFNYPNAFHYLDKLVQEIFTHTRRTDPFSYARPGDRPWNDPGPRAGKEADHNATLPTLKAVILDFSAVNNIDSTSIQNLIDVRNQLDRYTAPDSVEWHMANINNRWTKRALAHAGFGYPNPELTDGQAFQTWKPIFDITTLGGSNSAAADADYVENEKHFGKQKTQETHRDNIGPASEGRSISSGSDDLKKEITENPRLKTAVVQGVDRPFFHVDLTAALQSATASIKHKREVAERGGESLGVEP